tara:strand:+ start:823 stop:1944 length:1122 start_codon:yes stop_codon:yes gene_type:complete
MTDRAPLLHPLAGCDLDTYLSHLRFNSQFSERSLKQRILATAVVGLRQPFTALENLNWKARIRDYKLPNDPIFIVGHWRSGTTHLHNLLSRDPQFAFLDFGQTAMPHNLLSHNKLGRHFISKALPKKRGYDNVELAIEEPQEEEMALGSLNPLGYYSVYYFPQNMKQHFERSVFLNGTTEEEAAGFCHAYQTLAKKLSLAYNGKQLLFKNPPSTARITLLKELFPGARFIYIHRNPYEVFASSMNRYFRLMNVFAWQDFEDVDFEEMVFYKYRRLIGAYLDQRRKVPDTDMAETTYEKITEDPMGEIERLFDQLRIPNKKPGLEAISPYAEKKKTYKRNVHQLTQCQVDRIQKDWEFALKEWPYEIPEGIEVV